MEEIARDSEPRSESPAIASAKSTTYVASPHAATGKPRKVAQRLVFTVSHSPSEQESSPITPTL